MYQLTKKEAIAIFERAGYTYTGYKDAGWGVKQYHFTHPKIHGETCYGLSLMRFQARRHDMRMWHEQFQEELRQGIQQTLFCDWEYEDHYAIQNPVEVGEPTLEVA